MVVIVVHGGAGNVSKDNYQAKLKGVIAAANQGYALLKAGQTALDAVVTAVQCMEDDFNFNAGYGSSLTSQGKVENDAIVMNGKNMQVGAVACVTKFKNPVKVARLVMQKSDHCVLTGQGAHDFAQTNGIQLIANQQLVHAFALERLSQCKTFAETINSAMSPGLKSSLNNLSCQRSNWLYSRNNSPQMMSDTRPQLADHDTVGSVALDKFGDLASATSTGGLTAKAPGRIGDSPMSGSGAWAENGVCAVSTTGHGEQIMRVALAKHVAMIYQSLKTSEKQRVKQSVDIALDYMQDKVDGYGGVISIDADGQFAARFSTATMPWAAIDSDSQLLFYGILPEEINQQPL